MDVKNLLKNKGIFIVLIILIFYVAFAIFADIEQIIDHFQQIDLIYIIPVLGLFSVSLVIKSLRQLVFLHHIDIPISFKTNLVVYLAGLSMVITPGSAGEIIKSHFLQKKYKSSISKTMPIVLVERYHDVFAMFSIILIFSIVASISLFAIPLVLLAALLIVIYMIIKNKKLLEKTQQKVSKIKFLKFIADKSPEFNNTIYSLSTRKPMLLGWLVSVVGWIFDGFGIYFSLRAFGVDMDFFVATLMGFASVLFGAISFLPGGVGVTEVSMVQLLSDKGLDFALATAFTVFWRLSSVWYSTVLGIIATRFALKEN